jgi:predicted enzyme related to lactoylglutathione lyase
MMTDKHKLPVLQLRVALTTSDYERMMKFYTDGLGLDPAELWTTEQTKAALFEMGSGTLEIFDEAHAASVDAIEVGRRVSGTIRFALQVPDLQAAVDRLVAKGAVVVHPPVVTPWGDHNARLEDPDGMQFTLFETLTQAKE